MTPFEVSNKNGEDAHQAGFTALFPSHVKLNKASIIHNNQMTAQELQMFRCEEESSARDKNFKIVNEILVLA